MDSYFGQEVHRVRSAIRVLRVREQPIQEAAAVRGHSATAHPRRPQQPAGQAQGRRASFPSESQLVTKNRRGNSGRFPMIWS